MTHCEKRVVYLSYINIKPVPNPRQSQFFSFPASGNEIYIRSASGIRDIRQSPSGKIRVFNRVVCGSMVCRKDLGPLSKTVG